MGSHQRPIISMAQSSEALLDDLAKRKRMLTEQLEAINRQKGSNSRIVSWLDDSRQEVIRSSARAEAAAAAAAAQGRATQPTLPEPVPLRFGDATPGVSGTSAGSATLKASSSAGSISARALYAVAVDPRERAAVLLQGAAAARAESAEIAAAREALEHRVGSEGAELARLAATAAQLHQAQALLAERANEVTMLRAQLNQLTTLTTELLAVVDPSWRGSLTGNDGQPLAPAVAEVNALLGMSRSAGLPAQYQRQQLQPQQQEQPAAGGGGFDAVLSRLDEWAQAHAHAMQ